MRYTLSLKDLFEHADNHNIIDFIKEAHSVGIRGTLAADLYKRTIIWPVIGGMCQPPSQIQLLLVFVAK